MWYPVFGKTYRARCTDLCPTERRALHLGSFPHRRKVMLDVNRVRSVLSQHNVRPYPHLYYLIDIEPTTELPEYLIMYIFLFLTLIDQVVQALELNVLIISLLIYDRKLLVM